MLDESPHPRLSVPDEADDDELIISVNYLLGATEVLDFEAPDPLRTHNVFPTHDLSFTTSLNPESQDSVLAILVEY
jgi:hypothetical protein